MQRKNISRLILVSLICVFLSACTGAKNNTKPMSSEDSAELFLQMGARYLEMDMLQLAKDRLEKGLQLDSSNADIHSTLGVLYERLKRYDDAAEQYREAISIKADDAAIINNYGRFLCERGNEREGMLLLNQALEMPLNSRKWFAYTNAGLCLLRKGDQTQAEIHFRQALQVNSRYAPALFAMQKISYRSGEYMSARAFLERYLAVSKHSPQTLWYAVQTERALGNKDLADVNREKLFTLFPRSKEAQQLTTAIIR